MQGANSVEFITVHGDESLHYDSKSKSQEPVCDLDFLAESSAAVIASQSQEPQSAHRLILPMKAGGRGLSSGSQWQETGGQETNNVDSDLSHSQQI